MSIGAYTPTKNYADDGAWTAAVMDAFVDGLDTYLANEIEAKAPDKTGTETISGTWTFNGTKIFNGAINIAGAATFTNTNIWSGNNVVSGSLTFSDANSLVLPNAKPTVNRGIGISPDDGLLWYQEGGKNKPVQIHYPENHVFLHEDFLQDFGSAAGTNFGAFGFSETTSGTGADVDITTSGSAIGEVELNTGTTSSGYASILTYDQAYVLTANDIVSLKFRARINVQSDASEEYVFRLGFMDALNTSPTDGLCVRYNQDLTVDGTWVFEAFNNTASTTVDSGIQVQATGFYNFEIQFDGTTATFFIDGVQVGSTSTNIPIGRTMGIGATLYKNAGTTNRACQVDYISLRHTFTAGR